MAPFYFAVNMGFLQFFEFPDEFPALFGNPAILFAADDPDRHGQSGWIVPGSVSESGTQQQ
jgi:hypothetical protein